MKIKLKMRQKNLSNVKKILILTLLLSFLIFIFQFQLVFAQEGGPTTTIGNIFNAIGKFVADAFGYTDIKAGSDWRFVTVLIVIFLMLFFAFSDIIEMLTAFSKPISYILGFGLAVIVALTKGVLALARVIFAVTGGLGAAAVAIVIIIAFVAFVLIHLGIKGLGGWLIRRRIYTEAARFGAVTKAGAEKLKQAARL